MGVVQFPRGNYRLNTVPGMREKGVAEEKELRYYGDPVLRRACARVEEVDAEVRELACLMGKRMQAAGGIGLAAPQIGVSRRVIVVADPAKACGSRVLINPSILSEEGEIVAEEGCLSFPDIRCEISRAGRARVEWLDLEGKQCEGAEEDLIARVIQHEIDHLKGILFIDRISAVKRVLLGRKLKQLARKTQAEVKTGRKRSR